MIDYEFLERRFDQLNEDDWRKAMYMVDDLWDTNFRFFRREDQMVNDICTELYHELDSVVNEDIPF